MTTVDKENRLRLLAKRAGDLMIQAYIGGNRQKAIYFNDKRKRILWPIWSKAQEVRNAKNKQADSAG